MVNRIRLIAVGVTFAALAALPSAPATTQPCRGILVLETVTVLSDTDPDDRWPVPDRWTYHIYSKQNGILVGTGVQAFQGNTGKTIHPNLVVSNKIVGNVGDPVTLWLEQWAKERDPRSGNQGIPPADIRGNKNPFHWERETPRICEPGDERFTTVVDVPAKPGVEVPLDSASEHDGRLQFDWLWRFE